MSRSSQSRTNSTSRATPAAARSSAALTRRRGPRKDPDSDHFVLFKDGAPIGTIRYFPPLAKLGRLAVLKEGRGVGAGRLLCDALEEHLVHRRGKAGVAHALDSQVTIVANSQAHAQVSLVRGRTTCKALIWLRSCSQGFYAKLGYTAEGELFLEVSFDVRMCIRTFQCRCDGR